MTETSGTKLTAFVSGNFTDTLHDIALVACEFCAAGVNAQIKQNDSGPTSEEMILSCDVFVAVVGSRMGAIVTPTGDTLPMLELLMAIRERKPVVAFIKDDLGEAVPPRQDHMRQSLRLQLGELARTYASSAELKRAAGEIARVGVTRYAMSLRPNRVFICHSSKDKPLVERVVQRLKQAGFLTFYDKHDIGVGRSLTATIRRAIANVGYVAVFLSEDALASDWVRDEVRWAFEHAERLGEYGEDFILPVRVREFGWPTELEHLRDCKYADIAADFETGVSTLIAAMMPKQGGL